MAKLLHILGGGVWQTPTIERAKKMGYRVLISDIYKDRPGYALADHHEVVDIRDQKGTLELASRYRIDGILCDTTDVGVPTAAYVSEKLGLSGMGYETALNFTYKARSRARTAAAGILSPRFRIVHISGELSAAAKMVGFPLVVKPSDNQSSRGVVVVRDSKDLEGAYTHARENSHTGDIVVEQYMEGTELTVESVCWNGEVFILGASDKRHFKGLPQVASRLTYPPAFSPEVLAALQKTNEAVIKTLGLKTGVAHGEYMVNNSGVYLVEIAARGGGSRIHSHIAPYLSGVDAPGFLIDFSLGEPVDRPALKSGERAANLEFFTFPSGKVKSISGLEKARAMQGVQEIWLDFQVGDVLKSIADDRSRPGFVLTYGHTREEVLKLAEKVKSLVHVEVTS